MFRAKASPAVFPATIFDFNGVLVDDELVHRDGFRDVLTPLGVSFSDAQYVERYLGFDDVGAIRAMLKDAGRGAPDDLVAALVEQKRPRYMERAVQALVVYEGALRAVTERAKKGPVIIVSGALRDEITFALARMGIADAIHAIISAEDTPRCKPDPMGYQLGIATLAKVIGRARAEGALVVEDSLAGIEAAKAAGLVCLAVAHSYPEVELHRAGADAVVPHIRDLNDDVVASVFARVARPLV